MIKTIRLRNFRCFKDHTVNVKRSTIIVGQNNAGKSSLLEAFRLIGRFLDGYPEVNFYNASRGWGIPSRAKVLKPSVAALNLNISNLYHRYERQDITIDVLFVSGIKLKINILADETIFGEVFDPSGHYISSRAEAREYPVPNVRICPELSSLVREEAFLNDSYVRATMLTTLSSLHFRNELRLDIARFEVLKSMVEETWKGVRIRDLQLVHDEDKSHWSLMVQDNDFVAEIGSMGHGLQMWLQILWFLANCPTDATVIVDEPDVFIHPDLQHELMRLLYNYQQVIVATHSTEILSDALPENVLVLDRKKSRSSYANSLPGLQYAIESLGSAHTLQFARFHTAKACLFVEGNDIDLLKHMYDTLFPRSKRPLKNVPSVSLGGRTDWKQVIGAALFLENAEGEPVKLYCILDKDFRSDDEVSKEKSTATNHGFNLHVWSFRELENYLLVPSTIHRIVNEGKTTTQGPSYDEVYNIFGIITEQLKDDLVDDLALHIQTSEKKLQANTVNKKARAIIASEWTSLEARLIIIDAKKMLTKLSSWAKEKYGFSFSIRRVAQSILPDEIHHEVKKVLEAISNIEQFDPKN